MKTISYMVFIMFMVAGTVQTSVFAGDGLDEMGSPITCWWSENDQVRVCPDGNHRGPGRKDPKHTPPGSGIGGCNKDGTLCWNIDIGTPNHGLPIEVHGGRARNLIANGHISHANMSPYGVFHLNVWSGYHNSYFDCDVNVSRRTYHCVQEW